MSIAICPKYQAPHSLVLMTYHMQGVTYLISHNLWKRSLLLLTVDTVLLVICSVHAALIDSHTFDCLSPQSQHRLDHQYCLFATVASNALRSLAFISLLSAKIAVWVAVFWQGMQEHHVDLLQVPCSVCYSLICRCLLYHLSLCHVLFFADLHMGTVRQLTCGHNMDREKFVSR